MFIRQHITIKNELPMTEQMREITSRSKRPEHISSASLMLLLAAATIGALYYASFLLNIGHIGNVFPYMIVVVAESLVIFQALVAYWTILAGSYNPRDFGYIDAQKNIFSRIKQTKSTIARNAIHPKLMISGKKVNVDVFVTVYGEPLKVIENTVKAARDIVGEHVTYILDDGKSDEVRLLARNLGVKYIRRPQNDNAKAGNLNYAIGKTNGDYFAIFDADHIPSSNFFYETMPFFNDHLVAFVQTPQSYRNLDNPVSRGASYAQELFYRFIQAGKNRFNAAFCVGTNVVFSRKAILSIGGIYEQSNSEDIWTSLLLHEQGYRSVYIPDVLAIGEAPSTIQSFTKQQLRWATGGFEILLKGGLLKRRDITLDQKLQYLTTSMFYLLGLSVGLLFLLPPIAIFASQTPISSGVSRIDWFGHFAAFYGLQIVVASYCMRGFKFETLVLGTGSFPTYIKAFVNVLRRRSIGWKATGQQSSDSAYEYILPQVLLFIFLVFTSIVGLREVFSGESGSILAIGANLFNTYIIGYYLTIALSDYGREAKEPEPKKVYKIVPRKVVG
jgi:cellulose synthase (UDP-forming)